MPWQSSHARTLTGYITKVIDGDSVILSTANHEQLAVRLFGIDAPEHDQPFGNRAKKQLHNFLLDQPVVIKVAGTDRYGRILGCPLRNRKDACVHMVKQGAAWVYRGKRTDPRLIDAEQRAREQARGLWSLPTEQIVPPWSWRTRIVSQEPKSGCSIKGNISRRGQRVYHLPGQRHYQRTAISSRRGERWFCSEDEATAAGWRRSKR